MRRSCLSIAGVLLASALAGCGEPAEEGPKPYKETEQGPGIKQLIETQNNNMKNKSITTKGEEKPAPKKDGDKGADKKPAGTATPDKKN
jgi:hypothetical protein